MLPSDAEHKTVLSKIIQCLHSDIQNHIKGNNQLTGNIFYRPIKTDNGYRSGADCPIDTIIDWPRSFENIYGKSFEHCSFFNDLVLHLQPFFESPDTCPPRQNIGGDYIQEAKLFIFDLMDAFTTTKATYTFPPIDELSSITYKYLTRTEDEYFVEVPLLGIEVSKKLQFSGGELEPIDIEKRIDFMRQRGTGYWRSSQIGANDWTILEATTLLKMKLSWARSEKTQTLMCPLQLQNLCDNTLHLLRIYAYGGAQSCFQSYYVSSLGRQSRGTISSVNILPHRKSIPLDNPNDLVIFLDKHLTNKRIEDEHELGFIINRMAETWGSSRTNAFQVFDYVTILEAILVPSSESETSFKVSLYSAHLTAFSKEEKKKYFELIRKAYKVRNSVAHCKSELKAKDRLENEDLKEFGEIVHKIIRRAFNEGVDPLREEAKDLVLD